MKYLDILNKNSGLIFIIFAFLLMFQTCKINMLNTSDSKLRKSVNKLAAEIDSLNENTYNKSELDIRMKIDGLEISKRMLYDNNVIIRTSERPDDRMNTYDKEIAKLQDLLK